MSPANTGLVQVPLAYKNGYEKAYACDSCMAQRYISHTLVGDPVLDPIMEELSEFSPNDLHHYIAAGIDGKNNVLREAPEPLRKFFDNIDAPPWLDYDAFDPGIRAFLTNASLFIVAFVCGVLVEGFATLISKSFHLTERLTHTDRRLKQNNRQLFEVFLRDGLQRHGDGWKLSVRIRFVHARVRHLLENSDGWDGEAWGKPVSAAHLGYAISVFSVRLLMYAEKVGAVLSEEEKQSVVSIWRYVGYVMGIPETILYSSGEEALKVHEVGRLCEPPPGSESIMMVNALITAAPRIAEIMGEKERRAAIRLGYRLSRALIGDQLADELEYPKFPVFGVLSRYKFLQRVNRLLKSDTEIMSDNISLLMKLSAYDDGGLSYRLPDHVKHPLSSEW